MGEITQTKQRALLFCLHLYLLNTQWNGWNGRNGIDTERQRERERGSERVKRKNRGVDRVECVCLSIILNIMMCTHRKMCVCKYAQESVKRKCRTKRKQNEFMAMSKEIEREFREKNKNAHTHAQTQTQSECLCIPSKQNQSNIKQNESVLECF